MEKKHPLKIKSYGTVSAKSVKEQLVWIASLLDPEKTPRLRYEIKIKEV